MRGNWHGNYSERAVVRYLCSSSAVPDFRLRLVPGSQRFPTTPRAWFEWFVEIRRPGKELVIGRDSKSPVAVSVLSLGLLLPFGASSSLDRVVAIVQDAAAQTPTKHVFFVHGNQREAVETRTATVAEFLAERGVVRQPDDAVSLAPEAPIVDGSTVAYQPAVNIRLVVDGVSRQIRVSATTVGEALAAQRIAIGSHDRLAPSSPTPLAADGVITLTHVTSWLEHVRTAIAPPLTKKFDISMVPGARRVIAAGVPGTKETTVAVLQPDPAVAPKRMVLAARIIRQPQPKVVAEGIGGGAALGEVAHRGFVGTMRLADAALKMVATAYTASCSGCSGITASGRPAGHGIVAVDPRVIPLGTHLFIPGYGHAFAGDTGGAIHGNRIDLGFDSHRDALTFGRRPIVVYVFK